MLATNLLAKTPSPSPPADPAEVAWNLSVNLNTYPFSCSSPFTKPNGDCILDVRNNESASNCVVFQYIN